MTKPATRTHSPHAKHLQSVMRGALDAAVNREVEKRRNDRELTQALASDLRNAYMDHWIPSSDVEESWEDVFATQAHAILASPWLAGYVRSAVETALGEFQ